MKPARILVTLSAAILACACATPATPVPSARPSATAPEGDDALPPGCDPLDLRDPIGGRVVLDGRWTAVRSPPSGPLMTWWLFTQGDCVWGAGQVDDVGTIDVAGNAHQVQSLVGHINSDFTMSGEILWLGPSPPALPYELVRYSPLEMLIDFDAAGATILRESREGGVHGPRCPDPQSNCPPPLVLERAD